jgi:hypothetical protein
VKAASNHHGQTVCICQTTYSWGYSSDTPGQHRPKNIGKSRLEFRLEGQFGKYQHSTNPQSLRHMVSSRHVQRLMQSQYHDNDRAIKCKN